MAYAAAEGLNIDMIWFFERGARSLRIETRYDNDTSEYVVVVHYPDRPESTTRFADEESCRAWLIELESSLEKDQWARHGPPVFLPDGWRPGTKDDKNN